MALGVMAISPVFLSIALKLPAVSCASPFATAAFAILSTCDFSSFTVHPSLIITQLLSYSDVGNSCDSRFRGGFLRILVARSGVTGIVSWNVLQGGGFPAFHFFEVEIVSPNKYRNNNDAGPHFTNSYLPNFYH